MMIYRPIAAITAAALIGGCAHQTQLTLEPAAAIKTSVPPHTDTSSHIMRELELTTQAWQETSPATTIAPQLVAGDWLAWQCAIAGGYWDIPLQNAPAYAEVPDAH